MRFGRRNRAESRETGSERSAIWLVTFITPHSFDAERDRRCARVNGELVRTTQHAARFTVLRSSARWRDGSAMTDTDCDGMLREIAREGERRGWQIEVR